MKLKEKLCVPLGKFYTETSKELEKIADEFAIGFLHWYLNNDDIKKFSYSYENLLKTYKKEKGL
jgi:hypothetical protein